MSVFITTHATHNDETPRTFVRVNQTEHGAFQSACDDMATILVEKYEHRTGEQEIEYIERESSIEDSIVRIINPNNGYEYEALIISEEIVEE